MSEPGFLVAKLTPPALCSMRTSTSTSHCGAELLLGLFVPITAHQLQKHRSIGNPHVGLNEEHPKFLANAIQLRNNIVMRKHTHVVCFKESAELFAVRTDARSVFFTHEAQFLVCINVRLNVLASPNQSERLLQNGGLFFIGDHRFDRFPALCRISRIRDDQPVAVPIKRQPVLQDLVPGRCHLSTNSSSEQTATLPHLPEAISA